MNDSAAKRIVLTGVSRGLGLAMAEGFIDRGHTVLGCARGAAAIAKLSQRFGSPHQFRGVDVADDDEVRAWSETVLSTGDAPDLLINNAAVINRTACLWEQTADEFDRLLAVNVIGPANVIRHFVPAMIERGSGVIVNFSSGWGRSTSPQVAPYCASKFAIEGLTRALAQELPANMAAVPLNPGTIDTAMLRACFEEAASAHPKPEDWALRAVPFILSLGPRHNGQSLNVPTAAG